MGGAARGTSRGVAKNGLVIPAILLAGIVNGGCSLLPDEFNLSPLYRHRLDRDGSVREMDVLWPIFHYRKTPDGGSDFRIRPLFRHVAHADPEAGTESQFLVPLGRVRTVRDETLARLLPIWRYKSRTDDEGLHETDWFFALLLWGGTREDGEESYFAFLPFYADIPDFLTYDRFQAHLFPLHVRLEKAGLVSHIFLWPLAGFGSDESGERSWHRVLPLYSVAVEKQRYERYSALWPFVSWGSERLDSEDPIGRYFVFPLWGRQWSENDRVDAWTVLWPLFQKMAIKDRMLKLDVLWPLFRYHSDEATGLRQWWLWPLFGSTQTPDQRAWTALWPLIWFRTYDDPDGTQTQDWVLPFYWRIHRDRKDGSEDDFIKIWPLWDREQLHDGSGSWKVASPWPWRRGNAAGVEELYGWLWTLAEGEHTPKSSSMALTANLYTTAQREGRRQTSVPFLFNYEGGPGGGTLRLFQFLPIPWWGSDEGAEPR